MKLPKVSIITVVFNAGDLLEKTILSIAEQDFRDFEYIIIDGKSSDSTLEIIKKHEDKISFWISEKDKGLYDAMNKGIAYAQGEYIWFLHAGDTIPEASTLSRAFAQCNDADVIYGDTKIKDSTTGELRDWYKKKPSKAVGYTDFLNGMIICHQAIIIRKEIAVTYDLRYHLAGDVDWCIRSFRGVKKSCDSGVVLCHFLSGGISSKRKVESLLQRFKILCLHFGFGITFAQHLKFAIKKIGL
jgi:glycosyltransferase involved in cell wall biosynthesis